MKCQGRKDSSQGRRSRESSNTRLCYNCDKITNHFANTCPEPRKEGGRIEGRSITPCPRSRESSKDRGGANQGGKTYRILKASWGEEPLETRGKEEKKEEAERNEREEAVVELVEFKPKQREG